MNTILSILIPSIPDRYEMFSELFIKVVDQRDKFHKTHPTLGIVEIIIDSEKSFLDGGPSIGAKRSSLVTHANGKYLCFLDDDDDIAPNYVETLVRMCHENKDVVTFRNFTTTDFYWTLIDMSLFHKEDEQATPERIVKRRPWHICPVRSRLAKQFQFPDINYWEDTQWVDNVFKICETEIHTDQILSSYRHSTKTSEADRIIRESMKNL